MHAAVPTPGRQRRRILRALDVTPYVLRAASPAAEVPARTSADDATIACVLVLPENCSARQQRAVTGAMQALGDAFAQAPQVVVAGGELRDPAPPASAYLAFGDAQARALGRRLSADIMARAEVLLLDEPQVLLTGAGKRRLWQAVSGLRRHWRASVLKE